MNYIKEYIQQIENGKLVVGKKVKKEYEKILKESKDSSLPFYFDEEIRSCSRSIVSKNSANACI